MKRYGILIICLTFLLVSCNKFSYSDKVISFADDFVIATKAYSENTAEQVRENGFITACLTADGTAVFNEKVEYDGSFSAYRTQSKQYYYPSAGTVDFFCAFPASNSIGISGGEVTLSHSQDPDTDLLVAKRTGIGASDTAVVISFDHALSLIHFKAEGSNDALTYKIKSISIDVPASGVFDYDAYCWTPAVDSVKESYSSETVVLDGPTVIPGAVVFVPCEPKVNVQWDIYDGEILVASYSEAKPLGRALNPGEECTVTLVLPDNAFGEMLLDVVVNPWVETNRVLKF